MRGWSGTARLLLGALTGLAFVCACDKAPTAPGEARRYSLELYASAGCPTSGSDHLFQRTFRFLMVPDSSGDEIVLRLPAGLTSSAPNSGSLTLRLSNGPADVTGTLGGDGLAADGIHSVTIRGPGSPPQADAPVAGTTESRGTARLGTFSGTIFMSVYRSFASGRCTAADHRWRLTVD